jgi:hypothetical protein
MCVKLTGLRVGLGVMLVLAFGTTGWAADVGGGSGSSTYWTEGMNSQGGWDIGSGGGPVGISLDPNAGPWIKTLTAANGGGFPADDTGYTAPNGYGPIVENLVITGNRSWTDWHEDILTPGWVWGMNFFDIPDGLGGWKAAPGLDVTHDPAVWQIHGEGVSFTFNALAPGTLVKITKSIVWVGNPNVIGDLFWGTVTISEYPTPEPATLLLLALGGLAVVRRRRSVG